MFKGIYRVLLKPKREWSPQIEDMLWTSISFLTGILLGDNSHPKNDDTLFPIERNERFQVLVSVTYQYHENTSDVSVLAVADDWLHLPYW